jgi:hypothetical protein
MILNILSDTGAVSFMLYIFFITIMVSMLVIAIRIILKDKVDKEKFDRIVDLFKYAIVTVCITTVTIAVTDLFKERDYDSKEMTTFNTYIPYIIDSSGTIDKKINFCTFFSHVTPDGGLKDGWISYQKYLIDQKEIIETNKKKSIELSTFLEKKESIPTNQDFLQLAEQESQTQEILENSNLTENSTFIVILGADPNFESAKPEQKWARDNFSNSEVYQKGKWFMTVIPNINTFQEAKNIAEKVKLLSKGSKKAYVVSSKSWCENAQHSTDKDFLICN